MNPICDKCNHEVELFEQSLTFDQDEMVYTAYCHGEQEEVRLPRRMFIESKVVNITMGRAFKQNKLAG